MRTGDVLGRVEELARIEAFLDGIADGAAGLVLEGDAGIGKTELWQAAVAGARVRGYGVLEARPAEAERGLSFTGLADLLAAASDEIAELPPPQRRSLSVALLLEEPGGAPPDPRAIAVAALAVLRQLAARQPLVVAVDDVQWLDPASSAALSFALRRAAGERIGALLVRRSSIETPLELDAVIPRERIEVGPLSFGAIQRLLRDQLGASFTRSTLRRIHERSGGNPFFALELARALHVRGGDLVSGEELPVPDDLGRLVRERLAALPPETAEPLAAISALAEPTFRVIGRDEALDTAFDAGILVLVGERVRFAHPLLAAGAYEALAPRRRRALHRRLAEQVEDFEQQARHLALGADGPDPRLAALLEEAAMRAHARGAPEAAAELAELALRLDDGAEQNALARRTAEAAEYHMLAGDDRRAGELLNSALAAVPPGPPRAQLLRGLAFASRYDIDGVIRTLEEAVLDARDDPRLEAELLAELADVIQGERDLRDSEPYARGAVVAAERVGDPALLAYALSLLAEIEYCRGRGFPAGLMERALTLEPECGSLAIDRRPITFFGVMCRWAGDLDRSRALLAEARHIAEQRGDSHVTEVIFHTCFLELNAEQWQHGLRLADELCSAGAELERDAIRLYGLCARAVLLAHLGDEPGARLAAGSALGLRKRTGVEGVRVLANWALGLLELSLNRPAEALPLLRRSIESRRGHGVEEPDLHFAFPLQAEAAIAVGEGGEAEELLDWIEKRAVRLDRPWSLACAARCRGLLAAVRGDEAAAVAAFDRALTEHRRIEYRRFELARTLLAQGETLRRFKHKRAAREAIEAALAIFDELGAALWAAKGRRELARISGRRSAEGLTETERRVAELVAAGHSNKQVAGELFVTVRSVEANLTRIYAKLGVRSRTELANRLSR